MTRTSRRSSRISKKTKDNSQPTSALTDDEFYEVERVIDSMMRPDGLYYFVSWKGYSDKENSWEPAVNLDHLKVVKEYRKQMQLNEFQAKHSDETIDVDSINWDHAVSIKSATDEFGLYFRVEFSNGEFVWVPNDICRAMIPQLLLDFYENYINFD